MFHYFTEKPKKIFLLLGLLILLFIYGCSSVRSASYTALYAQQSITVQGKSLDKTSADDLAKRFVSTFNLMGTPAFMPAAEQLFARDSLYINDTLSVYHDYAHLQHHLTDMNDSIKSAAVTLLDDWVSSDSVYVHWKMDYQMTFLGSQKNMSSYGISQLKMNSEGKIIFQQDYWDSNNGLYRQLPIIGGFYRWVVPFEGL